jgi:pimeloyl-ACP methyl ester carboxylesterase
MKVLKFLVLTLSILLILFAVLMYEGDIPKDVVDARYSNPDSQFMDLGDAGLVHFRDQGRRHNPAVVLLHGSNASLHTFEPWVEKLSDSYRVITLDLPGHGLTGSVPSGTYTTASYINIVKTITDHLDIDRFVLGGNSMGGSVAWQMALANPELISGLVLIDAGGPPEWWAENDEEGSVAAFNLLRQPWFRFVAENMDPYYLVVQGVNSAYHNSSIINEALYMRYYELNLREGTRAATRKRFSQFGEMKSFDLSSIEMPTLVMWGKEDSLIPFEQALRFEQEIPNTYTAYYDDVGHMPMEEVPEKSANDMIVFLESLAEENES